MFHTRTPQPSGSSTRVNVCHRYVRSNRRQHLACDELEDKTLQVLTDVESPGVTLPQVARAVNSPIQTVRYRLSQLAAAGAFRGKWHRRFLFYYLNERERYDADEERGRQMKMNQDTQRNRMTSPVLDRGRCHAL